MPLQLRTDVSAADWIAQAPIPWTRLIWFGPPNLPAYVRLRYIPDPTRPGQLETDADVAEDHPSDLDQTRRALNDLRDFTTTPDDCYFCVWDGWYGLDLPRSVLDGPMVTIPHRRYFLLQGSTTDLDGLNQALGASGEPFPPAFAWPADQGWCFAKDVDPHWAGIGADRAAIERLLNDPDLDVVPAEPSEKQPTYY